MINETQSEGTIRMLGMQDIDTLERMEKECFQNPWSRETLISDVVDNPNTRYIGFEIDNRIVAYAGMWTAFEQAHVTNVAVAADQRRRGIGMLIMQTLIRMASRLGVNAMTLEVRVSNTAAQDMYKRLGFSIAAVRKKYYPDNGEDAYLMYREIVPDQDQT
jgi:[ribosomal protein S18]-alanine N-acetyltransferase